MPPPVPTTRRVFVAIRPSPAVTAQLLGLTRSLAVEIGPDVRWSRPDDYHVTLRYIGDAPTAAVVEAVDRVLPAAPVTIELGPGLIELGSAIAAPAAGADDLAGRMADALAGIGPLQPDRPFRGHLTLARWRRSRRGDGVLGRAVTGRFTATTVELLASVHTADTEESHYETIATWPLAGG